MNELRYLTIPEQIQNLKEKGLIIDSDDYAASLLSEIGYYKIINAYKHPFIDKNCKQDKNKYLSNTRIEYIYALYTFDKALSSLILNATTKVETTLKNRLSNLISQNYGIKDSDYLKTENFNYLSQLKPTAEELISQIKIEINKNIAINHPSILWYKNNYNFFPFWVISNVLSFGTVSNLYRKLNQKDQESIAVLYNLQFSTLESFIQHAVLIRNVCAHGDVLFSHKTKNAIRTNDIKNTFSMLHIAKNSNANNYTHGIKDFLSTLIVLKYLMSVKDFDKLIIKINQLLCKLKRKIPSKSYAKILNTMGLIPDWDTL